VCLCAPDAGVTTIEELVAGDMVIFRPRGVKKGNQATAAELEALFGVADVEECTRVILEDHVLRARNRTASDKAAGPKGPLAWHAVCGT
jgi:hypothetical protein